MRATAAILAVIGLGFLAGGVYRELRGSSGDAGGVPVLRYDLRSQLLDATVREVAVVPPRPRSRGLVVLLGGRRADPRLLEALRGLGRRAPVVLLPDARPAHAPAGRWESHVLVEAVPDARTRFGLGEAVAVGGPGAAALGRLDRGLCAVRASRDLRPLAAALQRCE